MKAFQSGKHPKNLITPENIIAVRASIEQSPKRSVWKHALALGILEKATRRILHINLYLYLFKNMICQKLSSVFNGRCTDCHNRILEAKPPIMQSSYMQISTFLAQLTNIIFTIIISYSELILFRASTLKLL